MQYQQLLSDPLLVPRFRELDQQAETEARKRDFSSSYNAKTTIAGNVIRVRKYSYYVQRGNGQTVRTDFSKTDQGEKLGKNLMRARDNLVDTINSNITQYSKFITLTFADPVLDRPQAMKHFHSFTRLFTRHFRYNLRYVGISERQLERGKKEGNSGSWHFHLAVFLDQFLDFDKLKRAWPYGSVDLKVIDKVENIGRYMAKYLTKQMISKNEKSLFKSYGLNEAVVRYDSVLPDGLALETRYCSKVWNSRVTAFGEVLEDQATTYIILDQEQ